MPVHLNSLTDKNIQKLFGWILQEELQKINDAFAQRDKTYFLGSTPLVDKKTDKEIGKYVFTFFSNLKENRNELLDVDIVLNNNNPTEIVFAKKLPKSSDSNEYYEAITVEGDQHLVIETVNRYTQEREIEGEKLSVYISAFPYELTVFKDANAFNEFFGFKKAIEVANTGLFVHGLGEKFIMPGNIFGGKDDENPWSFVVGTVEDFSEVKITFGRTMHKAYIIQLNTALGNIPVLAGKEVFDMKKLSKGKIVGMNAYLKANFVRDKYPNN